MLPEDERVGRSSSARSSLQIKLREQKTVSREGAVRRSGSREEDGSSGVGGMLS